MWPMRLAGTAKQYSTKAMAQLTNTTSHSGAAGNFSCPYQAKVMKTLEIERNMIGARAGQAIDMHLLNRFTKCCADVAGSLRLYATFPRLVLSSTQMHRPAGLSRSVR